MVSESPSLLQLLSWMTQRAVIHREKLQWCARACACRAFLFVTPPSIYCMVLQSCPVPYKADTACPPNPTVGGVEARSSELLLVQTVGRKKQLLLEVFGLAVVGTVSCSNETANCQTHACNGSLARHPVQAHWDRAQTLNLFYTFSSLSRPFVFPPSSLYVKTVTQRGNFRGCRQEITHMPRISLWTQGSI